MNWKRAGVVMGLLLGATLAVMLWPASDPLVGAEAVAIMSRRRAFLRKRRPRGS